MERTINAPDWEWGTKEQCAIFLGIDTDQFLALLKTGRFPFESAPYGQKNRRWHWMDVVCYSHMVQRNSAAVKPLRAKGEADSEESET